MGIVIDGTFQVHFAQTLLARSAEFQGTGNGSLAVFEQGPSEGVIRSQSLKFPAQVTMGLLSLFGAPSRGASAFPALSSARRFVSIK